MATHVPKQTEPKPVPPSLHLLKHTYRNQNPNHHNHNFRATLYYHQYNSPETNFSVSLLIRCLMMANFQPSFTSSTTTTSSSSPFSTMEGSSSQLSHNPVLSYLPPNLHQQQPTYFPCPPPMCPSPVPSSEAMVSRMVRQRRSKILKAKKDARAAASSSSSSSRLAVERDPSSAGSATQNEQQLYPFCTSDNKELRLLFKKELKNSDVGSLGRIVLPKKEAENYLPNLSDKKGIELRIRDALSTHEWGLKYKYWRNNKGRMYVLENTGDFVRETGVEVGDSIHLYEDECKNLYISIHRQRAEPIHVVEPSSTSYHQQNYTDTNTNTTIDNTNTKTLAKTTSIYTPYANNTTQTDKDENSSTVLAETNDNMVSLFTDPAPSYRKSEANNSNNVTTQQQTSTHQPAMAKIFGPSSSSSPSMVKISEDNFGDCYEGLGTLPEVHRFEYDFDDIMRDESDDNHSGVL